MVEEGLIGAVEGPQTPEEEEEEAEKEGNKGLQLE